MANREKFESVLEVLANEIQEDLSRRGAPSTIRDRVQQCLFANTKDGKLNRGLTVVDTGCTLLQRSPTPAEFQDLSILGWTVEMLQASYLVSDDIMDNSEYRRGKLCWYRQDGVGLAAINDASFLKSLLFSILKRHFYHHLEYTSIIELFNEASYRTELGQLADEYMAVKARGMDQMTAEAYSFIARNKTAFYSFYLPVALALHYLHLANESNLEQVKTIMLSMGEYFQVQDDYLDCFGDPSVIGKVGTDIEDHKCTWLIVRTLSLCSLEQRQVLDLSYGRQGTVHDTNVRTIFHDLRLERLYREYEDEKVYELQKEIDRVNERNGLKHVFQLVLDKISRRDK
ncbi:farnesyl pyrophosphate synthetase [Aspergillus sclerotialis]|uniref:Farnesyl pyrophosphate synthetase n=1 Tax=Aspergillus sclerotialis TaxID=2070753 RepID=A0A3A2ZM46_9EURO|nr:farnesyl pyrophosphate synthetase [Aspergillus sclerotialis]